MLITALQKLGSSTSSDAVCSLIASICHGDDDAKTTTSTTTTTNGPTAAATTTDHNAGARQTNSGLCKCTRVHFSLIHCT